MFAGGKLIWKMNSKMLVLLYSINCSLIISAAIIKSNESTAANMELEEKQTPWELLEVLTAMSLIRGFNGSWISDKEFIYKGNDGTIRKYNVNKGSDEIFVNSEILNSYGNYSEFRLSPDGKKFLIRYDVEVIFRHSSIAKYDIYDIATKKSSTLCNGAKLQYSSWSPVEERLAYVYDSNVFVKIADEPDIQLTYSGINGLFYNGIPDWVYEEEVLSKGTAMWWSEDGQKLAIGVFDDTHVQSYIYHVYGEASDLKSQYPKEVVLKYPKPGTHNPIVMLKVFQIRKNTSESVIINAPVALLGNTEYILQNVVWTDNERLLVTWLNRRQNLSSLQHCDYTGNCVEVRRLEEPNGWVDISTPICTRNGTNCIFSYWLDDWYQLWNLDLNSGINLWVKKGNFTIKKIYGYDEINDKLYYQATLPNDASSYHIYSNKKCLTCNLRDKDDGQLCRFATATFSTQYSYYAITCLGPNPSYTKIFSSHNNAEVLNWEINHEFRQFALRKLRPIIRYENVTLADGSMGRMKLQLPPNLDESRKYPLIVNVYGGPNSVRITEDYTIGLETYLVTKHEIIYAQIDGRGTGNKGKRLLFAVNNHLGEFEVDDQQYVTKYLQDTLSFVDKNRTGIWGWSYGGYITARTLLRDTERIFRCGISVAPVTSWIYYDTIYTERYMGLPTKDDNLEKYITSSVLQDLDNFRHHKFLLIHGSADDNVHYQQSLMLAKVLQRQNILFEEMTYTDENHSIGNLLPHLYRTMEHFWMDCFNHTETF